MLVMGNPRAKMTETEVRSGGPGSAPAPAQGAAASLRW